jgi:hypothetical protein
MSATPLGYVGVNGAVGTAHLLRHGDGLQEIERFFDQVLALTHRTEITTIRVSGHAQCSESPVVAERLRALGEEASRGGVELVVLPGLCGSGTG